MDRRRINGLHLIWHRSIWGMASTWLLVTTAVSFDCIGSSPFLRCCSVSTVHGLYVQAKGLYLVVVLSWIFFVFSLRDFYVLCMPIMAIIEGDPLTFKVFCFKTINATKGKRGAFGVSPPNSFLDLHVGSDLYNFLGWVYVTVIFSKLEGSWTCIGPSHVLCIKLL